MRSAHTPRSGISLFELLVVLAIFAILLGLLLPAVQKTRQAAARMQSQNNLKQMAIAMHISQDSFRMMPPSVGNLAGKNGTFFYHILPFIEQDNVYKANALNAIIKTYVAPADPSNPVAAEPLTSYATNYDVFGAKGRNLVTIRKGTSNTIGLVERFAVVGKNKHAWSDTKKGATYIEGMKSSIEFGVTPEKASNTTAHSFVGSGCSVAICDGSVRTITPAMKVGTFRWACDPDSNKAAPADW